MTSSLQITTHNQPNTIIPLERRRSHADFISFSPPDISEEEIQAVVNTLRSNWITTGPVTKAFEEEFAAYHGLPGSLALNSCTGALHVALAALDIGPGDEVITTPMTFCATANVIEHLGATTVLADIDADTLNISVESVRAAITPRTKAIIPVHFGGHPVDLDGILALAKEHGLKVIDDAAHALSSKYKGRAIGTISDFTAFSFYATKNLTTAEGGMLTGDPELLERARILSLHGMNRDAWKRYEFYGNWYYEVVAPGFKYNMTDIQAAIGRVQLNRLEGMQAHRKHVFERYQAGFADLEEVQVPTIRPEVVHAYHLYVLRINPEMLDIDRAQFIDELKAYGVGTSVHFIPNSRAAVLPRQV